MRIAYLDMTNPNHKCPSGFDITTSPKRACIRTTVPDCTSVQCSTKGMKYTKVCGRVRGYQDSTTDAFEPYHRDNSLSLNDGYVDGVSITQGQPRKHIWTFAAGLHDTRTDGFGCPCTSGTFTGTVPPFIETNYFCESGIDTTSNGIFADDPLWDGQDCPTDNECCTDNNPPWFCREVDASTSDIELRVCTDTERNNEDIQLELVEIYIQ